MSSPSLDIVVNGETRSVAPGCTLHELLEGLGLAERRIAVAINRSIVPRGGYADRQLAAGDRLEILEAVGGG